MQPLFKLIHLYTSRCSACRIKTADAIVLPFLTAFFAAATGIGPSVTDLKHSATRVKNIMNAHDEYPQGNILQQLSAMTASLNALSNQVLELKTEMTSLKTEVSSLKTGMNADVTELETKVSGLASNVHGIQYCLQSIRFARFNALNIAAFKGNGTNLPLQPLKNSQGETHINFPKCCRDVSYLEDDVISDLCAFDGIDESSSRSRAETLISLWSLSSTPK